MSKDATRDIIAVVIVGLVISGVLLVVWMNRTVNDTSHLTQLSAASEKLDVYFRHYDESVPLGLLDAKLDPRSFMEAATHAPDQGTANELKYIAALITQYNADGDVDVLHEAYALLNEILPHMLKE